MRPPRDEPEQRPRAKIDATLIAARWIVQNTDTTNLHDDSVFRVAEDPRCERLHPEVVRILRGMSGMERLRMAHEAWELARDRLTAFFGATHPEWTRDRIGREVAARLGRDAD